jgi:hypothetical protein
VPSTSALSSLIIAFRRAEIRAFWILTTAVCSLVLAVAAGALGAGAPWAWGVIGLGLPLPALIWPPWLEIGVGAWNKGVRLSTAMLRAYVLRVGYYLLFAAVARTGSSLDLPLGKADVSRWISRSRHELAFGDCDRMVAANGWWGRELLASIRRPGKAWQLCLLPVLLLLLVLREGKRSAFDHLHLVLT